MTYAQALAAGQDDDLIKKKARHGAIGSDDFAFALNSLCGK
jgi:hypothetical protein